MLFAALLVGALLALVGQTYQTGADTFELFAVCAAAILPWVLVACFPTLWVLWLAGCGTGFVVWTASFWGSDTMLGIHDAIDNTLIVLVAMHAAAAIIESIRHRENLVWSMLTGKKRP